MSSTEKVVTLEELSRNCLEEAKIALKSPYKFKHTIKNVAVIGAGPSGMAAARHLRDAGINVKVFERNPTVGGVWVYSDKTQPKPQMPNEHIKPRVDPEVLNVEATAEHPQRKVCELNHETEQYLLKKCPPSACYRDLYNNVATRLFAFPDFPFPEDAPLWGPRQITFDYLQNYARQHDLVKLVTFNTSVDLVRKKDSMTWELALSKYQALEGGRKLEEVRWKETFDAVVAASGTLKDPYVPEFKDLDAWDKAFPSKAIHSVQYRRPEDYKDKKVLIVGGSVSAVDIARSLDEIAASVTMSIKGPFDSNIDLLRFIRSKIPQSIIIKPNIAAFSNINEDVDGSILFEDGTTVTDFDNVIFCTGFVNHLTNFGDLVIEKPASEVHRLPLRPLYDDVPESHIVMGPSYPLNVYKEVFLMSDPTLAFVGMPSHFGNMTHFDMQARAVSRVWSGCAFLPEVKLMQKFTAEFDAGVRPTSKLYEPDRRKLEPFIVWLNHHAEQLKDTTGKLLPMLRNYDENYEQAGQDATVTWCTISDQNYRKVKDFIKENYL